MTLYKATDQGNVPLTAEEVAEIEQLRKETAEQAAGLAAKKIRAMRDALLSETDWVVIKAAETQSPVPQEWLLYRQALRDLPQQEGFPTNVQWPLKP